MPPDIPPITAAELCSPAWIAANRASEIAPAQWDGLIWFHARLNARRPAVRAALTLLAGGLWVALWFSAWGHWLPADNRLIQLLMVCPAGPLPGFGLLVFSLLYGQQAHENHALRRALEADLTEYKIVHERCYLTRRRPDARPAVHAYGGPVVIPARFLHGMTSESYRVYYLERSKWVLSFEPPLPRRFIEGISNLNESQWDGIQQHPPISLAEAFAERAQHYADWNQTLIRQQGLTTATHAANRAGRATPAQCGTEALHLLTRIIGLELVFLFPLAMVATAIIGPWSLYLLALLSLAGFGYGLYRARAKFSDVLSGTLATTSGRLDGPTTTYIFQRPEERIMRNPRNRGFSSTYVPRPPPATFYIGQVALHGLTATLCATLKRPGNLGTSYTACYWPHSRRLAALSITIIDPGYNQP